MPVFDMPVIVEFPAKNPRKTLAFADDPNAKVLPPRLKLVNALTTPPDAVPEAVTSPLTDWLVVNVLDASVKAASGGSVPGRPGGPWGPCCPCRPAGPCAPASPCAPAAPACAIKLHAAEFWSGEGLFGPWFAAVAT